MIHYLGAASTRLNRRGEFLTTSDNDCASISKHEFQRHKFRLSLRASLKKLNNFVGFYTYLFRNWPPSRFIMWCQAFLNSSCSDLTIDRHQHTTCTILKLDIFPDTFSSFYQVA